MRLSSPLARCRLRPERRQEVCVTAPAAREKVAGVIETASTAATEATTVRVEPPVTPSLVAEITTVPTVSNVTTPFTAVATALLDDPHVTVRPTSTLPLMSLKVAVNCCVVPVAP